MFLQLVRNIIEWIDDKGIFKIRSLIGEQAIFKIMFGQQSVHLGYSGTVFCQSHIEMFGAVTEINADQRFYVKSFAALYKTINSRYRINVRECHCRHTK